MTLPPMDPDDLDRLLAAVLDPAAARPSGRLRPVVVGWPHPVVRLPRRRRAGLVGPAGPYGTTGFSGQIEGLSVVSPTAPLTYNP